MAKLEVKPQSDSNAHWVSYCVILPKQYSRKNSQPEVEDLPSKPSFNINFEGDIGKSHLISLSLSLIFLTCKIIRTTLMIPKVPSSTCVSDPNLQYQSFLSSHLQGMFWFSKYCHLLLYSICTTTTRQASIILSLVFYVQRRKQAGNALGPHPLFTQLLPSRQF